MKWMIASDIHGSAYYCRKMIETFEHSGAEKLLLLGDILYHGPRNELPKGYAPKEVILMLNQVKEKILCVRGNCDAEVDQMVLEFPILADYAVIVSGRRMIYATHGHLFGEDNPPPLQEGTVLLCGHTHIPVNKKIGSIFYVNPGSVALPKADSSHSYLLLENGIFTLKELK